MVQFKVKSGSVPVQCALLPAAVIELSHGQLSHIHGGQKVAPGNSSAMLIIQVAMTVEKPVAVPASAL